MTLRDRIEAFINDCEELAQMYEADLDKTTEPEKDRLRADLHRSVASHLQSILDSDRQRKAVKYNPRTSYEDMG